MESKLLAAVLKIITEAGEHEAFTQGSEFHLRLEQPCFDPLVIESYKAPFAYLGEKRWVSVAHYFSQNGDLIADPDILMTYPWGIPIECQQVLSYTRVLDRGADGITMVSAGDFASVMALMDLWAENLIDQGWVAVAKAYGTQNNTPLEELS